MVGRLLEAFWQIAGEAAPPVDVTNGDDVLPSALATSELAVDAVGAASSAAATHRQTGGMPGHRFPMSQAGIRFQPPVDELMAHVADTLGTLGLLDLERCDGRLVDPIEASDHRVD